MTRCTPRSAPTACTWAWCCPGSSPTEGFPAAELMAKAATRWIVAKPETVAEAIVEAGPGGKAERYVPRAYWLAAARGCWPRRLVRRATAGGALHDRHRAGPDRDGGQTPAP